MVWATNAEVDNGPAGAGSADQARLIRSPKAMIALNQGALPMSYTWFQNSFEAKKLLEVNWSVGDGDCIVVGASAGVVLYSAVETRMHNSHTKHT